MKDLKISKLKDYYGALLTEKQSDAVAQYYDLDYSLKEISENLSVTRQAVHFLLKSAVESLNKYEEKLGFMSKEEKLLSVLETMKSGGSERETALVERISEIIRS